MTGTTTVSAAISGGGSIIINSGTLTLSGNNTYSGNTTLNAGTLNINANQALGNGAGTLVINNGGTINNTSGGNVTLTNNNPQSWNADFTFTGSNNLNLGTGNVTANANRTVTVTAKTLTVDGNITAHTYSLTSAGVGNLTLNGVMDLTTGGITANGTGTLTVSGNNTFSGNVTTGANATLRGVNPNPAYAWTPFGSMINETSYPLGNVNFMGSQSTVQLVGGNITVGTPSQGFMGDINNGLTFTFENVSGNNYIYLFDLASNQNVTFRSDAGNLTLDITPLNSFNQWNFPGAVGDNVAFTGNGTINLTYTANQTYAEMGNCTVGNGTSTGTLVISKVFSSNGGAMTISPNSTLQINPGGSWLSATANDTGAITDNGTIVFNTGAGAAGQTGVISGTGGVTQAGSGTLTLSQTNTYTGNTTILAGTVSIGADNNLGNTTGTIGTLVFGNGTGGTGGTLSLSAAGITTSRNILVQSGGCATIVTNNLTANTGTTTVNGTLTMGSGTTYLYGNSTLTGNGTVVVTHTGNGTTGDFGAQYNANSSTTRTTSLGNLTVNFASTAANQTVDGLTYGSLLFSNTGETANATSANITVNGNLTVTSSANFTAGAGNITIGNGTASTGSISNAGTLNFNNLNVAANDSVTSSGNFTVSGTMTVNGTFGPAANATITVTNTGGTTVAGGGAIASSGTINGLTLSGNLTLQASTNSKFTLQVPTGTGSNPLINVSGGTLTVGSTNTITLAKGANFGAGTYELFRYVNLSGVIDNFSAATGQLPGYIYSLSPGTNEIDLVVTAVTTATTVTSSTNPSVFGQVVTFTATVSSTFAGTPTGTVTFSDGGTLLGTAPLSGGNATCNALSSLYNTVATHTITASYSGDTSYLGSTSANFAQTVGQASSTTSVTSSTTASVFGQPVTFTAVVYPQWGGTATGTVTFSDGSTSMGTASVSGNSAIFTAPSTVISEIGTHTITAVYSGDTNVTGSTSATLTQIVIAPSLYVTDFTKTATGFTAVFNQPLSLSTANGSPVLNLYDNSSGSLGPVDVTLVRANGDIISGSLVVDPTATQITFIETGQSGVIPSSAPNTLFGVLPNDTYTVTLRSATNGFKDTNDNLLDGNADGTPGDDYVTTFVVNNPSNSVIVTLPDFARGAGQRVNVPNTDAANDTFTTGLPLRLYNSDSTVSQTITSVSLTLKYDSSLLSVDATQFSIDGPGYPSGSEVTTFDASTPGLIKIAFTTSTGIVLGPGGSQNFISLHMAVPSTANYAAKEILDLQDISINEGAVTGIDDAAVHVSGFLGDSTGDGINTGTDALKIARVAVGLDPGFQKWALADPLIIGDVSGDQVLTGLDALTMARQAVSPTQSVIPALPSETPTIAGPDPVMSISADLTASPQATVEVPVNLTHPNGLDAVDLAISYDPSRLDVISTADVMRGSLTETFDNFTVNLDRAAGLIRISGYRSAGPLTSSAAGSVAVIDFTVRANAPAGPAIINLMQNLGTTWSLPGGTDAQGNDFLFDLQPRVSNAAGDPLDGRINVLPAPAATRMGEMENGRTEEMLPIASSAVLPLLSEQAGMPSADAGPRLIVSAGQ